MIRKVIARYGTGGSYWKKRHRCIDGKGRVPKRPSRTWQVWNEPNVMGYYGGQRATAEGYGRLLTAADKAINGSINPRAKTVLGGLTGSQSSGFLRALYKAVPHLNSRINIFDQHAYATVGGQRVTFTAGPFDVSMLSPYPGATAGDTAQFYVVIRSAFQVQSVTAVVEGRSVALDFSNGVSWTGKLPLVGLAQGPKTTTLTVTDVAGHVLVRQYPFSYDRAPQLTVTSPQANDVALGGVRVQASCADDFGGPCTVRVYTPDGGVSQEPNKLVASGQGSIDATVPITFQAGMRSLVRVDAVDALGAVVARDIPLYWEDGASLTQAAAFGTRMLDVDATRLLYADSSAAGVALKVRGRSGGAEQAVPIPAGKTLYDAALTAYGVAFTVAQGGLYDWRGGSSDLVAVGVVRCQFHPHYVGCSSNGTYYDLAAHELRGFGGTLLDVADNGDAVWMSAFPFSVHRFRGGTESVIVPVGQTPRTDGVNVVFDDRFNNLYRYDPAGNELLATTNRTDYDAENGWIAYPVPITPGFFNNAPHQIFTRSPAGAIRQATSFSGGAVFRSLGPSGQVVFSTSPASGSGAPLLYASAAPYNTPVQAGRVFAENANGEAQPRIRWVGDELYLLLGRAALRVAY